jgi:hypothetical protein
MRLAGLAIQYNGRLPATRSEAPVEFVIVGTTLDGSAFRPRDWAERLCGVMAAFGGDPMAYRFLVNFAKDNELQVRDGRVAERTKLAEMQRVGDTA